MFIDGIEDGGEVDPPFGAEGAGAKVGGIRIYPIRK